LKDKECNSTSSKAVATNFRTEATWFEEGEASEDGKWTMEDRKWKIEDRGCEL